MMKRCEKNSTGRSIRLIEKNLNRFVEDRRMFVEANYFMLSIARQRGNFKKMRLKKCGAIHAEN
jgi:hypothetical protein